MEQKNPSKEFSFLHDKIAAMESEISNKLASFELFLQEWKLYNIKVHSIKTILEQKEKVTSKELPQYQDQFKNATFHFENLLSLLKIKDAKLLEDNHENLSKQWELFVNSSKVEKSEEWKLGEIYLESIEHALSRQNKNEKAKQFEHEEEAQAEITDLEERITRLKDLLAALKSLEVKKNQEDLENYAKLFKNINKQLATLQSDLDNLKITRGLLSDLDMLMRQISWQISALEERLKLINNLDCNLARKVVKVS